MRTTLLISLVVARAASAHADGVLEEVSAGSTLTGTTTPSVDWIADRVAGIWEIDDQWELRFDLGATRAAAPDEATGANTVFATSFTATYEPDDHWTLSVVAGASPRSTTHSSATILDDGLPGGLGEADAQLAAASSMMSLAASAAYDTAGTTDHETTATLTIGANRFQSIQAITSVIDPDGEMYTTQEVGNECMTYVCSEELMAALTPKGAQLAQLVIDANVTQTEYRDVDLGLGATYYLYDHDPTQLGYFSLATVGRGNLGNGIGVAPMRYALSPTVANRWGKLSGTLGLAYGSYIADQGYDVTASLRVQYKLKLDETTRLKLYGKLAGSWGVDQDTNLTTAISMALGGQYSW